MDNQVVERDLSIVVTCYNEEPHLEQSIVEIEKVMTQTRYTYEFIFVDDFSQDNTREVIKKICDVRSNIKCLFHEENKGRGSSVKDGLLLSDAKFGGFLDIDLEVHARYIPSMILALEGGADMVCADRIYNLSFGFVDLLRTILSKIYKKLSHYLLGIRCPDPEAGYKFFNLPTMHELIKNTQDERWFWDTEIVTLAEKEKKRVDSIPVAFVRRPEKKSTVRLIPDVLAHLKAMKRLRKNISI